MLPRVLFTSGTAVVAAALSLGVLPPAAAAAAEPVVAAPVAGDSGRGESLRVWVTLDGDTPVTGARVRVFAGGDRSHRGERVQPIRSEDSRTDTNGVLVLNLADAPRRGFTVVADRGAAGGVDLDGRLATRVRTYDERLDIVYVNPVTTLADRIWRERENSTIVSADRAARRALRIPLFHDSGPDLFSTDWWFDGDDYRREVRAEGSTGAVTADLADLADTGRATGIFRSSRGDDGGQRTAQFTLSAPGDKDDDEKAGSLIDKIDVSALLGKLTDFAKGQFADAAVAGGKLLLGYLLDQWGLQDVKEFLLPKDSSTRILEKLDTLLDAVTRVEGKVDGLRTISLRSDYTRLRNDLVPYEGAIESLYNQYRLVNATQNVADRKEQAEELVRSIRTELSNKQGNLARLLGGDDIGRDTVFKAASRLLADRPFFTRKSTEKIQVLYKTLSVLQLQEAVLLAEYHNAEFDKHRRNPDQAVATFEGAQRAVGLQAGQLKRAPEPGMTIDTNTRRVWTRLAADPVRTGNEVFQEYIDWHESSCTKSRCYGTLGSQSRFHESDEKWRKVRKRLGAGGPFGGSFDWRPGTKADIKELYSRRGGDTPLKFLQESAGMDDFVLGKNAGGPYVWVADAFEYYQYPTHYWFGASRIDLRSGDVTTHSFTFNSWAEGFGGIFYKWGNDYKRDGAVNRDSRIYRELAGLKGNVLYWRPLTDADDYYWR